VTDPSPAVSAPPAFRIPLWVQILIALVLGVALGAYAGKEPFVPSISSFGVEELGRLGLLVIRALKLLAVPLVALVILDALLRFRIEGRQGWRLARICLTNVAVAMVIGLVLVNVLKPGRFLVDLFSPLMKPEALETSEPVPAPPGVDPIAGIESMVPKSIAGPFVSNEVLGAALLALLMGAALRRVRAARGAEGAASFATIEGVVQASSEALQQALMWVVLLVPFAAFALVALSVGRAGIWALSGLWAFLAVILLGMFLHAGVYYPLVSWMRGGLSPDRFFGGARDAVVTGIATNSSLATLPVTLRCLTEKMGVSPEAARVGACLGTNFNNDGITLYEAMAVLIIVQACGFELGYAQQAAVVFASVMAGAGIAGIPEAGIVMLPMVLAASGLPEAAVVAAVPLVMPVDWILARTRTVVNVLSDMTVSILLDREEVKP
jgi:DAACS family dicarboxylate/amino acid:cation (Na+ or H+) symporter